MSSFYCEYCNKPILDAPGGYITECEHYSLKKKIATQCPNCLAYYSGKHECDGMMKSLVDFKKEQPKESWEEEFDKNVNYDSAELGCNWDMSDLKQFIQSLLDQQKKEIIEMIEGFPIHLNSITQHNAIIALIKAK